jgi:hypothetical protein
MKRYMVILTVTSERSAKDVQAAMLAALGKRQPDGTEVAHVAVTRNDRVASKVRL